MHTRRAANFARPCYWATDTDDIPVCDQPNARCDMLECVWNSAAFVRCVTAYICKLYRSYNVYDTWFILIPAFHRQ